MKRFGNLYEKVIDIDNLILADEKARKGKLKYKQIKEYDKDRVGNLLKLYEMLKNKTYKTSKYKIFIIQDPKEREIFELPYFPDRIVHHAIMNILEPIFVKCFISSTYSCIKKRGIHKALYDVRKALRNKANTKYCLKLDIKKFYPSINHNILKVLVRKKIKDIDLLNLIDEIIDSAPGIPIGNYLSQYFANFYLTYFDHWLKEIYKVKYFRYSDDMVILSNSKQFLHKLLHRIIYYLKVNLSLKVKSNYQIFPIISRAIDFVGYKIFQFYCLLRKSIKQNFARSLKKKRQNILSIAAYLGWLTHCNSKHLIKTLIPNYETLRTTPTLS